MDILAQLKKIEVFESIPDEQLQWLIDQGNVIEYKPGDHIFKPGDPIDELIILLQGQSTMKVQQGNQFRVVGTFEDGTVTGLLPYSRADKAIGFGQITKPSKILVLKKSKFKEMISTQEELTTALVHLMSTRIREFTKSQQQNDKMMALGKLSAGLAHELNNPSAAIVRSSQSLSSHLKVLPDNFKRLIKVKMSDEQADFVNQILFSKIESGIQQLSMLDRSEMEDDLIDWLDENNISDSDRIAENLVEFGYTLDDLDEISDSVDEANLAAVIYYMDQTLTTERLLGEIEEASHRINKLVSSVKSYTHMDQAPEKTPTDLHIGIENTLTMLNHKLNKSGIKVTKEFQENLPKPSVLASEMNQVWTNLIDNAIDAMENSDSAELVIKTYLDGDCVGVKITDSGSGIPPEIQDKIFDPFFTTKEIGKGTGLGMEVVHRIVNNQHNGTITFTSVPGKTEFLVSLPVKPL